MTTITITGLDAVAHRLKTIDDIALHLGPPMTKSLMHLQRRMARYPRKSPGAFTRLATPAQKRAYWARVKSGEISTDPRTGYRRSGTLGRKFSHKVTRHANGMTGELTNNAPGAIYVIGERQQPFHKESGWPQIDDVAAKESKAIQGYFDDAIRNLLRR